MSLIMDCVDCNLHTDCDWCEICSSFVCDECDLNHDCLASIDSTSSDENKDDASSQ